ncbi:mucin-like protein 2, partial [Mus caroli]|uniref:Mucin-like protein 2 n=1 Tax=Mus caroli TaxID=10089 RepID=A0A6P5PBS3_MUSCR
MKFLAVLVLLGVSTILVSCQDAETDSPDTSGTVDSNDGNIGSETLADTTGEKQHGESSDSANEESEITNNTNTANEASEKDNMEETEDDNLTGDDNSDQKEGDDNAKAENNIKSVL